ncbi:hypothetical protein GCM10022222_06220 [Amycolatopsis ultiminotia]|uniref:Uncharacterized protein n=1 Tax=Amycolatopsis ultiminotia TaxID=543629 RepID=A0ABP6V334_9PSEU
MRDYRPARPGITDADPSTLTASDGMFRMPARWCARAHADGRLAVAYRSAVVLHAGTIRTNASSATP